MVSEEFLLAARESRSIVATVLIVKRALRKNLKSRKKVRSPKGIDLYILI